MTARANLEPVVQADGDKPVRGRGRCPICGSRKVKRIDQPVTEFYARTLEICGNCRTAWEPLPAGGHHRDDDGSPFPFPEPCDNCAFRPGSPEQQDTESWRDMIKRLKDGGSMFGCHKGVPIDPGGPDGFAYPVKIGETLVDPKRLRPCRGYLNMITAKWRLSE